MAKTNLKPIPVYNHEGAKVCAITPKEELRRAVLTCMLWEDGFYEDGMSVANRIASLVPKVKPEVVAQIAIEARSKQHLRHVPLLLVREMARHEKSRPFVAQTLAEVIQRPDELAEFLSIYWASGKCPLANSVKKGLAQAFTKFNAYSLAKYNQQDKAIKLRDVLFLSHAKPKDEEQARTWKQLVNNELPIPNTWETQLSASKGANKGAVWTKLLVDNHLGAMALLRNLRNMQEAGVDQKLIREALNNCKPDRVLPFRFISAAKYAPKFEPELEALMFKCLESLPKLKGITALVVDTSPSMWMANVSAKSELNRFEAAAALAILAREVCESVNIYTFNRKAYAIPARHGFALRDVIAQTKNDYSCGSLAVDMAKKDGYDRIIVLTDGQWHAVDNSGNPTRVMSDGAKVCPNPETKLAYMINVSTNKNGVGYGAWHTINGWSEAILNYISASENDCKD